MALPDVFVQETIDQILTRLEKLSFESQPLWGKMNAPQMLAHLNVTYDLAFDRVKVKHNFLMKFMLKTFVKNTVVNEVPYKKNSSTAPIFVIAEQRDFEKEKATFIQNLQDTMGKGRSYFEGKESVSFGILNSIEWNNMFYKHIDHHFSQFGL
jgi:hypothetical protein